VRGTCRARYPESPAAGPCWRRADPVRAPSAEGVVVTRWRRRPDSEQCCGHHAAVRRLESWAEADVWLCRCCCVRCGHLWTEVGFGHPAHSEIALAMSCQLAMLGLHRA